RRRARVAGWQAASVAGMAPQASSAVPPAKSARSRGRRRAIGSTLPGWRARLASAVPGWQRRVPGPGDLC
ncbi:MAG: hypothetical protein KC464_33560, partial [Myxococcales bacterium]|nr:hypothetical protein [Myxococcales bacterium]